MQNRHSDAGLMPKKGVGDRVMMACCHAPSLQVATWAQQQLRQVVSSGQPLHLAKACMLIALEEEAAMDVHPEILSEPEFQVLFR